jgi:hypothetical protein
MNIKFKSWKKNKFIKRPFKRPAKISDKLKTKQAIELLESKGYFVRPRTVRRPKTGDTIRYRNGAGWKLNTHYYQTATVVDYEETLHPRDKLFKEIGFIKYEKRNKSGRLIAFGCAHPYQITNVSKPRSKKT